MADTFIVQKRPGGKWRVATLIGSIHDDVKDVAYQDLLPELVRRTERIVDGAWQPPVVPKAIIK